jgi:exodeoxyribonuclease VII small subunit
VTGLISGPYADGGGEPPEKSRRRQIKMTEKDQNTRLFRARWPPRRDDGKTQGMNDQNPAPSGPKEDGAERLSFESALEQLQTTVKRLESGELTLEQALKHFEDGVRLSKLCQERLTAAEQRVELLVRAGAGADTAELQPFSGSGRP